MKASRERKNLQALSGILFAAFFIASLALGGVLASTSLPLPGAPAAEIARYYNDSQTAVLMASMLQALPAISLIVFASCVSALVRRPAGESGMLPHIASGGGILAASFLLLSVGLSVALVPVAAGGNLGLIDTPPEVNFLGRGPIHIPLLSLFVEAASIAALRAKTLPRWIY